jgi:hypothetical protein
MGQPAARDYVNGKLLHGLCLDGAIAWYEEQAAQEWLRREEELRWRTIDYI